MKATKSLFIVFCVLLFPWLVHAGEVPGSYATYKWDASVTGLTSVDYQITVQIHPGERSNVRWATQFGLVGSTSRGYAGMENTAKDGTLFVFSVSGATQFQPGSPGSSCMVVNGAQARVTCRLPYNWTMEHNYQFHVAYVGGQWLSVTVTDPYSNQTVNLGSILTDATSISPQGMAGRTKYLEANSPNANCYNQPYTDTIFNAPTGNGGAYSATVAKAGVDANCANYGSVSTNPTGTEQFNLLHNTKRGTVENGGVSNVCIAAGDGRTSNTTVTSTTCDYHAEGQAWVLGSDDTMRLQSNLCMDVVDATSSNPQMVIDACNDSASQQWVSGEGNTLQHVQTGLCATLGQLNAPLTLQTCVYDFDQTWYLPYPGLLP